MLATTVTLGSMKRMLAIGTVLGTLLTGCSSDGGTLTDACLEESEPALELPVSAPTAPDTSVLEPPAAPPERPRPLDLSVFADDMADLSASRVEELDSLLTNATIPDITRLFDEGRLTSVELVTYYLKRIERFDVGRLNSIIELDPSALVQAETADRERSSGTESRPMLGIPVLLKDNIAAGPATHTTAGALALSTWRPQRDAELVGNLRRAGAIILGKTNMSEWANFMDDNMPSGYSTVGGQTNNPYGYPTPFGSSSGSAVAASAGFAALTVGTETQGSIISPAGINSAVGFKPSRGLVSRDLIVPLYEPQDTAGPMGRNVLDVAIGLSAMAGFDADDPRSKDACALLGIDFADALTVDPNVRVGVTVLDDEAIEAQVDEARASGLDPETLATVRQGLLDERERSESIATALESAGVTVVRVNEALEPAYGDLMSVLPGGFRRDLDAFLAANPDIRPRSLEDIVAFNDLDPEARAPFGQASLKYALSSELSDAELLAAAETLEADSRRAIDTMLAEHDITVYVTTSNAYDQAGYPAISVPFTYDVENGPSGVVFSGAYLSDVQLLATAHAFEKATKAWIPPNLGS